MQQPWSTGESGLPPGLHVLERSWLSSNGVLFIGAGSTALVDSGYCTDAQQTVALVERVLQGRRLDRLVNTHLHSDHCGGNAALQARWPAVRTWIPPGLAAAVAAWDTVALGYQPEGQVCPRFRHDALVRPGTEIELGDRSWQVHAAPGHDPDSVILFEPRSGTLISADALWENGFGIVFPELEGASGFDQVSSTFDLIEQLAPSWVIPGHGRVFRFELAVLGRARDRLQAFMRNPSRHAHHAAKALLKFRLLETRQVSLDELVSWAAATPRFGSLRQRLAADTAMPAWIELLTQELVRAQVLRRVGDTLHDA
ncbi:MBL fold metallo-hydrolase [Hydrogenophaga intermedia]|uniref:MBL fold metallo-hydrolase n=1 Tax=Hydrogenophaga intermedia TaxID=65786 RepID=UPI00204403FA|nr:MBL fold metallo-hydrolase [Hydrogenophaga intermedia]MCM3562775.1 MBL fold metallo-hydrolase [Hydrogenophaga intermedia]